MNNRLPARMARRATMPSMVLATLALMTATLIAPMASAEDDDPLPPLGQEGDILFIAGGGIAINPDGNYAFYFDQDGNAQQDECDYLLVIHEYRKLPALILGGKEWYATPYLFINTGIPSPLSGRPIIIEAVGTGNLGYKPCTIYVDNTPYISLLQWLLNHDSGVGASVQEFARRFEFDPFTGDISIDMRSECNPGTAPRLVFICPNGNANATVAAITLCGRAEEAIILRTNAAGAGCRTADVAEQALKVYKDTLALVKSILDEIPEP